MSVEGPLAGAPGFDLQRFYGTWHILVTNYGYWKSRRNPTVTYEPSPAREGSPTFRDTLRFMKRGIFGGDHADQLGGIDVELERGRFVWRGDGLLRLIKSPWWVLLVDDAYEWAVTYFGRSNVGTAPGMDIYARRADLDDATMREILLRVRAHPFLRTRCDGLFATTQGAFANDRYRLAP